SSLTDGAATVWDPVRNGVIAYGDYNSGVTLFRGLAAEDEWLQLASVGETPALSNTPAVYDGPTHSIVSFGGYAYRESNRLVRLSSEPGSKWEDLMLANSPGERSSHLGVLDEANHRFIVYGGVRNSSYPPSTLLDDCWSLSLDGTPVWSRIETRGTSPGA